MVLATFECKLCSFKSRRRPDLEDHVQGRHGDIFIRKYDLRPQSKTNLIQECLSVKREGEVHPTDRQVFVKLCGLACPKCDVRTTSRFLLEKHTNENHQRVNKVERCKEALKVNGLIEDKNSKKEIPRRTDLSEESSKISDSAMSEDSLVFHPNPLIRQKIDSAHSTEENHFIRQNEFVLKTHSHVPKPTKHLELLNPLSKKTDDSLFTISDEQNDESSNLVLDEGCKRLQESWSDPLMVADQESREKFPFHIECLLKSNVSTLHRDDSDSCKENSAPSNDIEAHKQMSDITLEKNTLHGDIQKISHFSVLKPSLDVSIKSSSIEEPIKIVSDFTIEKLSSNANFEREAASKIHSEEFISKGQNSEELSSQETVNNTSVEMEDKCENEVSEHENADDFVLSTSDISDLSLHDSEKQIEVTNQSEESSKLLFMSENSESLKIPESGEQDEKDLLSSDDSDSGINVESPMENEDLKNETKDMTDDETLDNEEDLITDVTIENEELVVNKPIENEDLPDNETIDNEDLPDNETIDNEVLNNDNESTTVNETLENDDTINDDDVGLTTENRESKNDGENLAANKTAENDETKNEDDDNYRGFVDDADMFEPCFGTPGSPASRCESDSEDDSPGSETSKTSSKNFDDELHNRFSFTEEDEFSPLVPFHSVKKKLGLVENSQSKDLEKKNYFSSSSFESGTKMMSNAMNIRFKEKETISSELNFKNNSFNNIQKEKSSISTGTEPPMKKKRGRKRKIDIANSDYKDFIDPNSFGKLTIDRHPGRPKKNKNSSSSEIDYFKFCWEEEDFDSTEIIFVNENDNLKEDCTIQSELSTCQQCNFQAESLFSMREHVLTNHMKENKSERFLDSSDKWMIMNSHGDIRCAVCEISIQNYHHLKEHFHEAHHGATKYNIQEFKNANEESEVEESLSLHHCTSCGHNAKSSFLLQKHARQVHNIRLNPQASPSSLQQSAHFNFAGVKPRCSLCNRTFTRMQDMKRHKLYTHMNKKQFKCDQCTKRFWSKETLDLHGKMVHSDAPSQDQDQLRTETYEDSFMGEKDDEDESAHHFPCLFCDRQYGQQSLLHRHMKVVHPDQAVKRAESASISLPEKVKRTKQFVCTFANCRKKFYRLKNLEFHQSDIHLASKEPETNKDYLEVKTEVNGDDLEESFLLSDEEWDLEEEQDNSREGEKKFKCDKCDSSYSWKHHLSRHQKHFHQNVDSERSRSQDNEHQLDRQTFACDLCERTYSWKQDLKRHQKKSHPEFYLDQDELQRSQDSLNRGCSYTCTICNKIYRWKHHLKRHLQRTHAMESHSIESHLAIADEIAQAENIGQNSDMSVVIGDLTDRQTDRYVCKACGKSFGRNEHLKRHILLIHFQFKSFECSACPDSKFAHKYQLERHQELEHSSQTSQLKSVERQKSIDESRRTISSMNCLLINGEGDDDSRLDIQIKIELDLDEEQNAAATY